MLHKTLETKTTITDVGEFEAIAAAYSVDRVNDRIKHGAFANTITAWQTSGKMIPLHWDHRGDAENVIGFVDPASLKETEAGLYVKGKLDLGSSEVANEAWRVMKNNAAALSFGYLVKAEQKSSDGVNDLLELDLFEITVTPHPANPDTRFLSLKAFTEENIADLYEGELEIAEKAVWTTAYINDLPDSAFLFIESDGEKDTDGKTTPRDKRHFPYKDASGSVDLPHLRNALSRIPQAQFLSQGQKDSLTAKARRILDNANKALSSVTDQEESSKSEDPLRKQTFALALEIAGGDPNARYTPPEPEPEPEPLDAVELRRLSERAALDIALG